MEKHRIITDTRFTRNQMFNYKRTDIFTPTKNLATPIDFKPLSFAREALQVSMICF